MRRVRLAPRRVGRAAQPFALTPIALGVRLSLAQRLGSLAALEPRGPKHRAQLGRRDDRLARIGGGDAADAAAVLLELALAPPQRRLSLVEGARARIAPRLLVLEPLLGFAVVLDDLLEALLDVGGVRLAQLERVRARVQLGLLLCQ